MRCQLIPQGSKATAQGWRSYTLWMARWLPQIQITFHWTHLPLLLSTQLDSLSASHTVSSDWRWVLIKGKGRSDMCHFQNLYAPSQCPHFTPHNSLSFHSASWKSTYKVILKNPVLKMSRTPDRRTPDSLFINKSSQLTENTNFVWWVRNKFKNMFSSNNHTWLLIARNMWAAV